jgi:hypothetical protein
MIRPSLFRTIRLLAATAGIIALFLLAEHSATLLASALLYVVAAALGAYLLLLIARA